MSPAAASAATPPPSLRCTWVMATLQPPALRLTLTNSGPTALHVLAWGTPFEGWLQPFVRITRDGADLAYQGPTVKRGDPGRDEYIALAAGRSRSVTLALAPAFDASQPGRYRIEPRLVLHDVAPRAPRPRSAHAALALTCPAVEFEQR